MLWAISKPSTNLSYLNDVLAHFIISSRSQNRYLKQRLFPSDFIAIHDNNSNNIKPKFQAVFKEIRKLELPERRELIRVYLNNQRVESLCLSKTFPIKNLSTFSAELQKAMKDLGEYLYSNALKLAPFTSLPNVNHTLREHWIDYKNLNGKICCFCGINEYIEQLADVTLAQQFRPAFDHYLPKEKYPFSAVNFNNLVPICDTCNGRRLKGSKDPCNCNEKGRVEAFFPYNGNMFGTLEFDIGFTREQIQNRGSISEIWTVDLLNSADEKQTSWNRLFNIVKRIKGRVNNNYVSWLESDILTTPLPLPQIKTELEAKGRANLSHMKDIGDGYHKGLAFLKMSQLSDDMLEVIVDSIGYMPQPQNSTEVEQLLESLGIRESED